jgi:hypothetical protein
MHFSTKATLTLFYFFTILEDVLWFSKTMFKNYHMIDSLSMPPMHFFSLNIFYYNKIIWLMISMLEIKKKKIVEQLFNLILHVQLI